ncbi:MAG: MFS transporter [Hyphomonadaceae bacterium]|nr:MFS transporter [Hyphomonadaceae bacterium]MBC6412199.1 MFS transporter [Hyphomonadaceae bacterium]
MKTSEANIIRQRIDDGPLTPAMVLVVAIAFMLSLLDGFDVISISVAATALSNDWGISRGQLGPIFSAALVGMTLGAALLAPLADRIGRRRILLLSTLFIGTAMILTGQIRGDLPEVRILGWTVSQSILLLMLVRFVAGLGVGVVFANAATIASEAVPEQHRDFAVLIAIAGYPFGATLVGPIAHWILENYNWQMVFTGGGAATLLMSVVIFFWLPESVDYLAAKKDRSEKDLNDINAILKRFRRDPIPALPERTDTDNIKAATVGSILAPQFRWDTIALWTTYFMGFMTLYFLLSWIPTLFEDAGYSRREGIQALTYFNLGGVTGIVTIGLWAKKVKLSKPIALFFVGGAVSLSIIWALQLKDASILNALIFANGVLLQGAFSGLYAVAARYYPTTVRATGVGWGAGLGRVGAIVSPIIAGVLAAGGWGMYPLFVLFAVPLLIAAAMILRFKL